MRLTFVLSSNDRSDQMDSHWDGLTVIFSFHDHLRPLLIVS